MQIQNPMMFVRSIKGAPSSVLWVLVLVRQALTVNQLCAFTNFKPDAIREAVNVLKGYELVVERKGAHGEASYSLKEGYQFLLPGIDPAAMARIEGQALPAESDLNGFCAGEEPAEGDPQNPFKTNSGAEKGENDVQNRIKTDSGAQKTGSINLIDDDELINPKDIHHQSEPENSNFPELEIVLENLPVLFGGDLCVDDLPEGTSSTLALAWVAKIYQDTIREGSTVKNPLGILRARLKRRSRRKLHLEKLPNKYLLAIGMEPVGQDDEAGECSSVDDVQAKVQAFLGRGRTG